MLSASPTVPGFTRATSDWSLRGPTSSLQRSQLGVQRAQLVHRWRVVLRCRHGDARHLRQQHLVGVFYLVVAILRQLHLLHLVLELASARGRAVVVMSVMNSKSVGKATVQNVLSVHHWAVSGGTWLNNDGGHGLA